MAVTKQQMQNAINGYKNKDMTGNEILDALAKRKDAIGDSFREDLKSGVSREEFAGYFGFKPEGSFWEKTKSRAESAYVGTAKTFGGIVQGALSAGDWVNEKINPILGTNMNTHAAEDYKKSMDDVTREKDRYRQEVGRGTGTDWVETGAEVLSTLPAFMAGKGKGLIGRAGTQAGIGTAVGAAHYAKDSNERLKNMALGLLGGGAGELGGALIGKGATRIYNASKGVIKPEYKALSQLGKQHDVPLTAGDIMRNPIIKKAEKLTENVPVVGMAGYREAQHGSAKKAAGKVVQKLDDALNATDYKALDKIQANATAGDRNANRILGIVQNAKTPDEILQASLEVRKYREKTISDRFYDKVQQEVARLPNATVTPNKTTSVLNGKLDELSKSLAPDDVLAKDLQKIKSAFDDPNVTKDFNNMRLLRSQLGDMAEKYATTGANPNKAGSAFLGDLRQAVDDDISDFVASTGNDSIKTAYKKADGYYRQMVEKQDKAFGKAMDSNKPDEIYKGFIAMGKGDRAKNFYNALDPKGQAALRLKMAEEAMSKATNESTGHFSPAKFAKEFEDLNAPYSHVFQGTDKAEMDGFVKLMRHAESAGQYMENPPNGSRIIGGAIGGTVAVNPIMALKGAGVTALAKTLFTSKAGKNLLMAANKLEPGATGMANVLKAVDTVMASSGANAGISDSQQPPVETPPVEQVPETAQLDPVPTEQATQTTPMPPTPMPPDNAPPMPVIEQTQVTPMVSTPPTSYTPPAGMFDVGMPTGNAPSGDTPTAGMPTADTPPIDTNSGNQEPPVSASEHIGQTLAKVIPPPSDTADPKKMAVYEQASQQAVGAVMQTMPMQQISMELETAQPNERKIRALQQDLAKTPEWQSFVQTLPRAERQSMNGADILALITRNVADNATFAPQF